MQINTTFDIGQTVRAPIGDGMVLALWIQAGPMIQYRVGYVNSNGTWIEDYFTESQLTPVP